MAGKITVGLDASAGRTYYAAVARQQGRHVLVAAGALAPGEVPPQSLAGEATHVALRAGEALVIALPGVAIEEAEEAFRWEVAKSGAVSNDALRHVHKRGPGTDSGPPFLGVAGDAAAAEQRASLVRDLGLATVAVTLESCAIERLLYATGKLPARGTVIHVDVRDGTSIVSVFGGAGLALRRTIRTQPIDAEGLAIDIQRSASYGERKLSLPAAEAVYLSGEGVNPELIAAVAHGLPGLTLDVLDPFAGVEVSPRLSLEPLRELGLPLAVAIGLALFEAPVPDFLPPVERAARTLRMWRGRARAAALALVPLVLGCGFLMRGWIEEGEKALASAQQRHARVQLLRQRSEDLLAAAGRVQAWKAALRQLGEREQRVSALVLRLLKELPDEAYLTSIELRAREADAEGKGVGDLDIRVRGEFVVAAENAENALIPLLETLRKAARTLVPGTEPIHDVARKAGGMVRRGFSIDGVVRADEVKE